MVAIILMALALGSCSPDARRKDDPLIARAYQARLYRSDITGIVPRGISAADSTEIIRRYIDSWVRQQVLLHHAGQSINPNVPDIEKKVNDYRNSLILFHFETELVRTLLDTVVTENQIAEYYEQHQNDFRLQENIVKVNYVKVLLDAPDQHVLRRLYRATEEDDLMLLEDYCIQHAANYYIDNESWLLFSDLLREIPLQAPSPEAFLRSNRSVELSDELFRYYLFISDYKVKGNVSPLAFERDNIRSIILNRRKHTFINQKREAFFQQALSGNHFEIF